MNRVVIFLLCILLIYILVKFKDKFNPTTLPDSYELSG